MTYTHNRRDSQIPKTERVFKRCCAYRHNVTTISMIFSGPAMAIGTHIFHMNFKVLHSFNIEILAQNQLKWQQMVYERAINETLNGLRVNTEQHNQIIRCSDPITKSHSHIVNSCIYTFWLNWNCFN